MMDYLVVKTLHIVLVISWFAGLFYLPRIFVNLAMVPPDSRAEYDRLLLMAGKLYRFMTPIGYLSIALGLWLWLGFDQSGGWLHVKTLLVVESRPAHLDPVHRHLAGAEPAAGGAAGGAHRPAAAAVGAG